MDPKDHEELKAEKAKLDQSLAEAEHAKVALEKSTVELMRVKIMTEKERDEANIIKARVLAQVGGSYACISSIVFPFVTSPVVRCLALAPWWYL